jgi:hypothetical protein
MPSFPICFFSEAPDFEFAKEQTSNQKFSDLHLNRPSDQLSWRTPYGKVVDELSAAAALVA